jgi:hypothetical protein
MKTKKPPKPVNQLSNRTENKKPKREENREKNIAFRITARQLAAAHTARPVSAH